MKSLVPLSLLALGATSAHAAVLINESFDGFAIGPLNGQNGYSDQSGVNGYGVVAAGSGKAVLVDSRQIPSGSTVWTATPNLSLSPNAADPIVRVSVDLTSIGQSPGAQIDDAGGSNGILISTADSLLARFTLTHQYGASAAGLSITAPDYDVSYARTIRANVVSNLAVQINTATNRVDFFFDNEFVAGISYFREDALIPNIDLIASRGSDRVLYDNLRVEGRATNPVPEPASLAALGLGALALVRRRRR